VDIRLVLACDHFTQVDGETSGTFRVRFADSWFFAARSLVTGVEVKVFPVML
jgi:hypothetical protein